MAETIVMPFGILIGVGSGNHVLDGAQIPLRMGNFEAGNGAAHCKVYGRSAVSCAKTAEPIETPFGTWTRVGPRNHILVSCTILIPTREAALLRAKMGPAWDIAGHVGRSIFRKRLNRM